MFIFPKKLNQGDVLRIIAPSTSMSIISPENRRSACSAIESLGLRVSFGRHVESSDMFTSSSIKERLEDLHEAFSDSSISGILTVIGGYNCNQLLPHIDYDLVEKNPKILCGYSDITAIQNAFLTRTGLVTYSGPHFSSFSMEKGLEFTISAFVQCLFSKNPFTVPYSERWSDDRWYVEQNQRTFERNRGPLIIQKGEGEGHLIGGNLSTLNLLQGTSFMPPLDGSVIFIEEDHLAGADTAQEFDRNLESLFQLPSATKITGVLIGRFQKRSNMTSEKLIQIVRAKERLASIPVVADLDFGHTTPHLTLPIGARVQILADQEPPVITVLEH